MCGIFGFSFKGYSSSITQKLTHDLFLLSESRGKEAAGLAALLPHQIQLIRAAMPASSFFKTPSYLSLFNNKEFLNMSSHTLIGHSRLVTTGSQHINENNQPVYTNNTIGVHNGIIVNHEKVWSQTKELNRKSSLDSEVIFALIGKSLEDGNLPHKALFHAFQTIQGVCSIAFFSPSLSTICLATNNGSLYYLEHEHNLIFASEFYILDNIRHKAYLSGKFKNTNIQQLQPNQALWFSLNSRTSQKAQINGLETINLPSYKNTDNIEVEEFSEVTTPVQLNTTQKKVGIITQKDSTQKKEIEDVKQKFPFDSSWQNSLKRCSKCLLPETMPFISFDENGVCNYCQHHQPLQFHGEDKLKDLLKSRLKNKSSNCIIGVSGGRDSIYSLHYAKTVLDLNPIAFTFDWGMVTDLARRNISRICGKLGIEHIIVSADIDRKRLNIKKNVEAWLKKPKLGMIPLFMAGDKQYFYYLEKVKSQNNAEVTILGENMLERTDFKTGFAGIPPFYNDPNHVYTLPSMSKLKHTFYYLKNVLSNPRYINTSIFDTAFAYYCYYMINRNYLNLYKYIPWEEDVVVPTLLNEYDFECSPDSTTTWRIGDGTAAFYNYIFYQIAGFSEHDTFRSNQIREGLISREKALKLVQQENQPRYETIQWYFDMIGLKYSLLEVFEIIHSVSRLPTSSSKLTI